MIYGLWFEHWHDISAQNVSGTKSIGLNIFRDKINWRKKHISGQNVSSDKMYQRKKCISRKHIGKHESEKLLSGDAGLSSLQMLG